MFEYVRTRLHHYLSGNSLFVSRSFLGASTQSTIRAVFQHGADILQLEDSALETPGGRTDEEHGTETLSRTKRQATSKASPLGKMMTTRVNLPSTQLDEEDARPSRLRICGPRSSEYDREWKGWRSCCQRRPPDDREGIRKIERRPGFPSPYILYPFHCD
jgi:hypothetical protein